MTSGVTRPGLLLSFRDVLVAQLHRNAAELELKEIGIQEVDRLTPAVIYDATDFETLRDEFIALFGELGRIRDLEREVIHPRARAETPIDPCIKIRRQARYIIRFHERDEFALADVEEGMANSATGFDLNRLTDNGWKAKHVFVEVERGVHVVGRYANVMDASIHDVRLS
jgi:hypothetical protein